MDKEQYNEFLKSIGYASNVTLDEVVSDYDERHIKEIKSLNLDKEITDKLINIVKARAFLERSIIKTLR